MRDNSRINDCDTPRKHLQSRKELFASLVYGDLRQFVTQAGQPGRRVALLIESSRAYGRGLMRGIAGYVRDHGHWSVRHQELSIDANPPRWLAKWNGDGILVRMETSEMARVIEDLGLPAVDLRCWRSVTGVPGFDADDASIVRLAMEHLRKRGFSQFGFCGFEGANYSARRLQEMRKLIE